MFEDLLGEGDSRAASRAHEHESFQDALSEQTTGLTDLGLVGLAGNFLLVEQLLLLIVQ